MTRAARDWAEKGGARKEGSCREISKGTKGDIVPVKTQGRDPRRGQGGGEQCKRGGNWGKRRGGEGDKGRAKLQKEIIIRMGEYGRAGGEFK